MPRVPTLSCTGETRPGWYAPPLGDGVAYPVGGGVAYPQCPARAEGGMGQVRLPPGECAIPFMTAAVTRDGGSLADLCSSGGVRGRAVDEGCFRSGCSTDGGDTDLATGRRAFSSHDDPKRDVSESGAGNTCTEIAELGVGGVCAVLGRGGVAARGLQICMGGGGVTTCGAFGDISGCDGGTTRALTCEVSTGRLCATGVP